MQNTLIEFTRLVAYSFSLLSLWDRPGPNTEAIACSGNVSWKSKQMIVINITCVYSCIAINTCYIINVITERTDTNVDIS